MCLLCGFETGTSQLRLSAGIYTATSQQTGGIRGETGIQGDDLLSNYLPASPPTPFCNLVINLITVPAPGADPAQEQELCQEGLAPCVLSGFRPRPQRHTRATPAAEANPIASCRGLKH